MLLAVILTHLMCHNDFCHYDLGLLLKLLYHDEIVMAWMPCQCWEIINNWNITTHDHDLKVWIFTIGDVGVI
jgi:hypothetical protein